MTRTCRSCAHFRPTQHREGECAEPSRRWPVMPCGRIPVRWEHETYSCAKWRQK